VSDDLKIRLLIVDDEQSIRRLCRTVGESLGFACLEADSGESALARLEEQPAHMVLTDMVMPRMSGLKFLEQVKKLLPRTEVAVMTGHGSIETAVQAMKLGAYDYITKPFSPLEELRLFLRRMADKVRLVEENQFLRDRTDTETELHGIVGSSAKIQDVLRMVSRLKDTRTPVLISGESGTGKELVARAIHFRGVFANRPFVAVDCGSLVPTLIESELFGYEKGAFTGALKSKQGLFQSADGGTVFLDEIGELPPEMQAKLLRVLQEKEVRPVGSNQKFKVDVRVIAATNRDLEAEYRRGTFRKDLYFRLNVVTVHLPCLRERRSDIPMLVHWFLDRYAPESSIQITNSAMKCLLQLEGHAVATASDGGAHEPGSGDKPHPRAYGTYPRILGRYARAQGLLTLEEAVRKMSGLAAETFQLHGYGRVEAGARANLVVFDPAQVIDRATFDDSKQYPAGIEYVIVGGNLTIQGDRQTELGSGRAVRFKV